VYEIETLGRGGETLYGTDYVMNSFNSIVHTAHFILSKITTF